ncbi:2-aminoethanethiol (cysteamine) dioxygenase b [Pseudoliparis swirei]|uniref:2-aminoethanethiol (cysteamine) dioxygenase b n=1 Tax=Pseudoliparis swirei TaxID=2059687 RepID=UPI0024BE9BC7|nr:2-aminoethanethiol (cysteamine) dioxygenase b [Pseudoliparis swirei]XP_056291138.1 2-aminoethanethiol (cysteamine) dioxygenase b [Pseudoliparis swirei]
MMPGDSNMTSIVQRIARQALITFRNPPRIGEEAGKSFLENESKLKILMTEVRAADLKLAPRRGDSSSPGVSPAVQYHHHLHGGPPVTYMHICETDQFSMGVFLLKSGASIPLHDHPGMHGMLKVLYGKVRIRCFDRPERPAGGTQAAAAPALPPAQMGALWRSLLGSNDELTEESGPCVLSPGQDNLHQIDAVDGPTAFMDILAPPYDPDEDRDCHYYKVLAEGKVRDTKEKEAWLLEISQPAHFWCGGEPYPGPEVCL